MLRCFEQLYRNIEATLEIFKNVIIVGDFNEDLLNYSKHYLKDVLLINAYHNIVIEPTLGHALLDPILVPLVSTVSTKIKINLEGQNHVHFEVILSKKYTNVWYNGIAISDWYKISVKYTLGHR